MAHVPAWLSDVVDTLIARYEAEAVLLIGSQARDTADATSDYNLLAVVDDAHALETGLPPLSRVEALPGFARPVTVLRATLAEVMAGLYSGHAQWESLTAAVHPLHDPFDVATRIAGRRRNHATEHLARAITTARSAAEAAQHALAEDRPLDAALLVTSAAHDLAAAAVALRAPGEDTPARMSIALSQHFPELARELETALRSPADPAATLALERAATLLGRSTSGR